MTGSAAMTIVLATIKAKEEVLERLMIAYSPKVRRILDAAHQRIQRGQGVSHEDFWQDVGKVHVTEKKSAAKKKSA